MGELRGVGIGRGVAAGRVARLPHFELPAGEAVVGAAEALRCVATDLRKLALTATPQGAAVLEAQAMMACDPLLAEEVVSLVDGGATAARAIGDALDHYAGRLAAIGGYLAARVADIEDVKRRAIAACLGVTLPGLPRPGHPYVLVARDLAPADTVTLDGSVLAIVTVEGGPTSHTAILARAMGIPAVVACPGAFTLENDDLVTVDAARGLVLPGVSHVDKVSPSTTEGPGRTADGYPILLQANIGALEDIPAALAAGAEGVGLLRTEFLDAYGEVFDAFPGGRVVVRVFDAGADKPLPGLSGLAEPNPALGVRGVRALRANPLVLQAQLASIAMAAKSSEADVWVMAPMVSEPGEAAWFAQRVAEHGLRAAGVMIEVPSAALLARETLSTVDFASVGTNDLAQFTLAADRQLGALAPWQDPAHPAVLRLVAMVGRAASELGKPLGVCGEAAADPRLACVLVGLGVTSLSMAPAALACVRDELARHTLQDCRLMAEEALRGVREPAT
jgi:phosphotransferase system enzyme I (PtsI)